MSDTLLALGRAKAFALLLRRFTNACSNNLYIVPWPLKHMPAWRRGLQVFEGVPEVYPPAMALIEAIGPGQRWEVNWLAEDWSPTFRARVGDAAFLARDLIQETWGWQPGIDRVELDRLVAERKRTGLPTAQRQNADWQAIIDSLSQEEWIEANMGSPPFREAVDPTKREQFDRIVEARLDRLRQCAEFSFGPTDFSYWTSEAFANETRWLVFAHIDDLDALEANWNEPITIDPRVEAELHDYEERPLIGKTAARLPLKTLRLLGDSHHYLVLSIRAARRRIERANKRLEPNPAMVEAPRTMSSPESSTTPTTSQEAHPSQSVQVIQVSRKGQPRNQDKATRCLGAYIDAMGRGETPPTPSELAKRFDCSTGTASRAIKPYEDKRKAFGQDDFEERLRNRG